MTQAGPKVLLAMVGMATALLGRDGTAQRAAGPGARASSSYATAATSGSSATGTGAATAPTSSAAALPAPRTFHDPAYKVSFDFPGNWTFTRRDGEISTFRLDARSAARKTSMRAVASIPENPFPASTFSGAFFYLSVTPRSTDAQCAEQATDPVDETEGGATVNSRQRAQASQVGALNFAHGHLEQRSICTTERDEVYTVFHRGACYRFDLAMNNFCGGEVSGVKDVTQKELDQVLARMQGILSTVRFDPK